MNIDQLRCLPAFQGGNSVTFRHPPLDGSLTVAGLYAHHAEHSPKHPLFVYADEAGSMCQICYPEAVRAAIQTAALLSKELATDVLSPLTPPVIGILAAADTISCFTLMLAIMYLGCTPFPISTRNSASGVAHLLQSTGTNHVFVSSDTAMQRLAHQAAEILKESCERAQQVSILRMPIFTEIYAQSEKTSISMAPKRMDLDSPALILHSSGSTAFPKPIKFTNRIFLQWGLLPYYGDVDICGLPIAAHVLPMFHAMGSTQLVWSACAGSVVACFRPTSPPILPTPDVFLKSIVESGSKIVFCVPSFVEVGMLWPAVHELIVPTNIPFLRDLIAVVYAGAPLNTNVGTTLSNAGVTLTPFYGSTEVGCFNVFLAKDPSKDDWQYLQLGRNLKIHRVPHEGVEGVFEPIVIATSINTPNVLNTEVDGQSAYATSDLLEVHPTKPHLVRVYGRVDDQLMLSTGEKTNPTPLETILAQDPHVATAIMFGRGRFQNGVLIQPREEFDPKDEIRLAEFRNQIWPSVERLNAYAPTHSRLFKEMIIVTNPLKPLEFTPKGTPRRQVCLASYAAEIDALYDAVEESSQKNIQPPQEWSPAATLEFTRKVVNSVMVTPISDDEDMFQSGCDSLQATWIRNTIFNALRTSLRSSRAIHGVPHGFVYSHPTIHALCAFVHSIVSGTAQDPFDEGLATEKAQAMAALVEKYTSGAGGGKRHAQTVEPSLRVTLLTGSTGRFGSYILAKLLERDDVETVYVFVRGHSVEPLTRLKESFERWGLDVPLLASPKLVCLLGELTSEKLGLEPSLYDSVASTVTSIIHNGVICSSSTDTYSIINNRVLPPAWQVDFNLRLSSFEPLFVGLRYLINLALAAQHGVGSHFSFVSSMSVLRGFSSQSHPAPSFDNIADAAIGSGYSESKDPADVWNEKEWVPQLIAMCRLVGKVPMRDEQTSWLPANLAALSFLDLIMAKSPPMANISHLLSPLPIRWNAIFEPVSQSLRLPLIPYHDWILSLESEYTRQSLTTPITSTLLNFFQGGERFQGGPGASLPQLPDMLPNTDPVVELRAGSGIPLIVIHGITGGLSGIHALSTHFESSPLWAVHVTQSVPLDSLSHLVGYYRARIKAKQPRGPYRLASFSGTGIICAALVHLFEDTNDEVCQLAFIDGHPVLWSCPDYGRLSDTSLVTGFAEGVSHTLATISSIRQLDPTFQTHVDSRPDAAQRALLLIERLYILMAKHLVDQLRDHKLSIDSLQSVIVSDLSRINAPICTFIASDGTLKTLPHNVQEEWRDLGSDKVRGGQAYHVQGGHYAIMDNKDVARTLEHLWRPN
ncbi:hypothetical protein ONZ45_g9065 [Pleurotus djamor]|nr:hypothetical protein ONZ45_g9065 [Pleurotus djamor]